MKLTKAMRKYVDRDGGDLRFIRATVPGYLYRGPLSPQGSTAAIVEHFHTYRVPTTTGVWNRVDKKPCGVYCTEHDRRRDTSAAG